MRTGRPKLHQVMLSESQREDFEAFAHSRSLPHGLSRRAAGVLHASEGMPNTMLAEGLRMTETRVGNGASALECGQFCRCQRSVEVHRAPYFKLLASSRTVASPANID